MPFFKLSFKNSPIVLVLHAYSERCQKNAKQWYKFAAVRTQSHACISMRIGLSNQSICLVFRRVMRVPPHPSHSKTIQHTLCPYIERLARTLRVAGRFFISLELPARRGASCWVVVRRLWWTWFPTIPQQPAPPPVDSKLRHINVWSVSWMRSFDPWLFLRKPPKHVLTCLTSNNKQQATSSNNNNTAGMIVSIWSQFEICCSISEARFSADTGAFRHHDACAPRDGTRYSWCLWSVTWWKWNQQNSVLGDHHWTIDFLVTFRYI